jgi:protein ImuA
MLPSAFLPPSARPPVGLGALRAAVRMLERGGVAAQAKSEAGGVRFGIDTLDAALGGGLAAGALHEIATLREPAIAAASGFALALAALSGRRAAGILWIAEDMALLESGAPHGPGLDALGLAPERLLTVAAAKSRDVLWAMEEALRCRAVGAVIGEVRHETIDLVATRRLSLAAAKTTALALLLRTTAPTGGSAGGSAAGGSAAGGSAAGGSAALTRWIVGGAASAGPHGPGPPRFAAQLVRNRRGPLGTWMLEFCRRDQRFLLASAHPEPVAAPVLDRPAPAARLA